MYLDSAPVFAAVLVSQLPDASAYLFSIALPPWFLVRATTNHRLRGPNRRIFYNFNTNYG